jgi:hypothetical protein
MPNLLSRPSEENNNDNPRDIFQILQEQIEEQISENELAMPLDSNREWQSSDIEKNNLRLKLEEVDFYLAPISVLDMMRCELEGQLELLEGEIPNNNMILQEREIHEKINLIDHLVMYRAYMANCDKSLFDLDSKYVALDDYNTSEFSVKEMLEMLRESLELRWEVDRFISDYFADMLKLERSLLLTKLESSLQAISNT